MSSPSLEIVFGASEEDSDSFDISALPEFKVQNPEKENHGEMKEAPNDRGTLLFEDSEEDEESEPSPDFLLSEESEGEGEQGQMDSLMFLAEIQSAYGVFEPEEIENNEDSGPVFTMLDLKEQAEVVKAEREQNKITELSRILQGLPENQLISVINALKETHGDKIIESLEEQTEIMKNKRTDSTVLEEEDRWDWNTRFQSAISKVQGQTADTVLHHDDTDQMILWSFLSKVAGDFVQIATVYGKIIISEVYTPIAEKTIKPMHMGGRIGGDKYLVKKVLFKFPKAEAGFYDEAAAAKIAGHELKGMSNLFDCGVVGLHFPMLALIDYLGFRLIAMTHLPLAKGSLIYGSNDGGKTIKMESEELGEKLEETAKMLNIKPHYAGRDDARTMVYSPADLEGHVGSDSKFYLLDFSRVFPPEPPIKGIQGSHLFRLLRPELVRSNPIPLCPDAFSGFITDTKEAKEHNREIQEAANRLFRHIIPSVGKQLNQLSKNSTRRFLGPNNLLVELLHSNGINIRFIGHVRRYVQNEILRAKLMVEILSRTLKTIMRANLRQAMKESCVPMEHSYKRCVVSILNQVFGIGNFYWINTLIPAAKLKFVDSFSASECVDDFCMKSFIKKHLGIASFFLRFLKVGGLVFNTETLEDFQNNETLFEFRQPFDIPDIEELGAQVHHMNIVDNAMGFVLKCRAQLRQGENSDRLCRIALRRFENALYSNPKHIFSLRHYAGTLVVMGNYRQASEYYRMALEMGDKDVSTLYEYCCFLLDVGSYNKSILYFEKVVVLNPPELFALYREYSRKIQELPNKLRGVIDILEKLKYLFPETGKKRLDKQLSPRSSRSMEKASSFGSTIFGAKKRAKKNKPKKNKSSSKCV